MLHSLRGTADQGLIDDVIAVPVEVITDGSAGSCARYGKRESALLAPDAGAGSSDTGAERDGAAHLQRGAARRKGPVVIAHRDADDE